MSTICLQSTWRGKERIPLKSKQHFLLQNMLLKLPVFFFFFTEGYFKTCPGPKVGFIAKHEMEKKNICVYIHFGGMCIFGSLEAAHTPNRAGNPPCSLLPFINIIDVEFVDRINLIHSGAGLTEPRCNENLLASCLKHGCLRPINKQPTGEYKSRFLNLKGGGGGRRAS